jgi:hypothetical protein
MLPFFDQEDVEQRFDIRSLGILQVDAGFEQLDES